MNRSLGPAVVTLVAVVSPLAAQAPEPNVATQVEPFRTDAVAQGVWVVRRDEGTPPDLFAASIIVVGRDAALLVDAGGSPRHAERLRATVRAVTDRPLAWIVNTHGHGDHVYGNATLSSAFPEARIVAHEAVGQDLLGPARDRLQQELQDHRQRLSLRETWLTSRRGPSGEQLTDEQVRQVRASIARRREMIADLERVRLRPPDLTMRERMRLELGGRRVTLLHPGPAHTRGDLIIHVPDAGVVAVGDLLEEGGLWTDGADLPGWVAALDQAAALDADVIVPAHGDPQRDRSLLLGERDFLAAVVARARTACAAGKAAEEAAGETDLERLRSVFGVDEESFKRLVTAAMERAYENVVASGDSCAREEA